MMVTSVDDDPTKHNKQELPHGLATHVGGKYAFDSPSDGCNQCDFYLARCDLCISKIPKVSSYLGQSSKRRMRQTHSSRVWDKTALSTVYSVHDAYRKQTSKVGGVGLLPISTLGTGVSVDGGNNPHKKSVEDIKPNQTNIHAAIELTDDDYLDEMAGKILVIIDSGASDHMFNDVDFFRPSTWTVPESYELVTYANGIKTPVTGRGDTCLVKDAIYVPNMKLNVISVSRLDRAGYGVYFTGGRVNIMLNTEIVMTGTLHRRIYQLDHEYVRRLIDRVCNDYEDHINYELSHDFDIIHSADNLTDEWDREPSDITMTADYYPDSDDPGYDSENPPEFYEYNPNEYDYDDDDYYDSQISESSTQEDRGSKRPRINTSIGGVWMPSTFYSAQFDEASERNFHKLASVQTRGQIARGKGESIKPILKKGDGKISKPIRKVRFSADVGNNPLWRLHLEMGHMHPTKILKAYKVKAIQDDRYNYEDLIKYAKDFPICPDCLIGGMRAIPVPKEISETMYKVLEKIGIDYKGPFKTKARGGYKGFYLFSDQSSDLMWSYAVKGKGELLEAMICFWKEVIEPYAHIHGVTPVRIWQSDYNKEQLSSDTEEWVASKSSRLRSSPPYVHSKNGQIERDVQTVLDKSRTVMAAYNCGISWWYHAVKYTIYSLNRTTTIKIGDIRTPFERLTGIKPKVSHMVPFFCPGLYHITKEEIGGSRSNWEAKAKPCRMIGYDEYVEDGYHLYDLQSMQEVRGRTDVVFDSTLLLKYVQGINDVVEETANDNLYEEQVNQDSNVFDEINHYYVVETLGDNFLDQVYDGYMQGYEEYPDIPVLNNNYQYALDNLIHHVASATLIDTSLVLPTPPKTIAEALDANNPLCNVWEECIIKELNQFDVYKIFERGIDQNGHGMKTKFIFTVGYRSDFTIKYKARLVVCGYSQIKGIDYEETFSPTAPIVSIFMVLRTAAVLDFEYAVCDVTAAFFEGEAEFDQFCFLPKEISSVTNNDKGERVKIIGNMYGEKQAPKVWNDKIHNIITGYAFERSPWDPCIYWLFEGQILVFIITIHVDDMLLLANSNKRITDFYDYLNTKLKHVSLFQPNNVHEIKYIGMVITKVEKNNEVHFELSQEDYINKMELFQNEKFKGKEPIIPIPAHVNLRIEKPNPHNESLLPVTGTLRYVCDRTRPDVLLTTGEISTGGSGGPSDMHYKVAKQAYRYLKATHKYVLRLGGVKIDRSLGVLGRVLHFYMTDATYVTIGKSKSRLAHCGWIGYRNGAYISTSVNDTTVSLSSMESEVKALSLCCMNIVSSRRMLKSLGYTQGPTYVFIDNKAAIDLAKTLKTTPKSKHIQPRINYIRERINEGDIQVLFVPSRYNVADMLTKPVPPEVHADHTDKLLNGFSDLDPLMAEVVSLDYVMARI